MKTYRIISEPHYCNGDYRLDEDGFVVGARVHLADDTPSPDSQGDVRVYLPGTSEEEDWFYVGAEHLQEVSEASADTAQSNPRIALINQARELLGGDADALDLIAMATYLEHGAA